MPSFPCKKYNSNVIETCLKNSGEEGCVRIVRELVNSSLFGQLLQDHRLIGWVLVAESTEGFS